MIYDQDWSLGTLQFRYQGCRGNAVFVTKFSFEGQISSPNFADLSLRLDEEVEDLLLFSKYDIS